jgi:hypothetical protein
MLVSRAPLVMLVLQEGFRLDEILKAHSIPKVPLFNGLAFLRQQQLEKQRSTSQEIEILVGRSSSTSSADSVYLSEVIR